MVIGTIVLVGVAVVATSERSGARDDDVSVFLEPTATSAEIEAVRRRLGAMKQDVRKVRFVDRAQAYKEMEDLFESQPEVVEAVAQQDAPPSFRVTLRDGVDPALLRERLDGHPGVQTVVYAPRP
jgi:cell division protein FtsX